MAKRLAPQIPPSVQTYRHKKSKSKIREDIKMNQQQYFTFNWNETIGGDHTNTTLQFLKANDIDHAFNLNTHRVNHIQRLTSNVKCKVLTNPRPSQPNLHVQLSFEDQDSGNKTFQGRNQQIRTVRHPSDVHYYRTKSIKPSKPKPRPTYSTTSKHSTTLEAINLSDLNLPGRNLVTILTSQGMKSPKDNEQLLQQIYRN